MKKIKYIYKLYLNYISYLRQLENKELEKLPKWFIIYQYNLLSRIIRFIAMFIVVSSWYHTLIKYFLQKLNIIFILNQDLYLISYWFIFVLSLIFLFLHCILNIFIRIYYFRNIITNSTISIMQCISTGLRICRYSLYGIGLVLGIPGIDYVFERNGQKPPLRHLYLKRHIQFFEANEVNCAITEGKKIKRTGIVSHVLASLQDRTETKEHIANQVYLNNKNSIDVTEKVIKEL